VSNLKNVRVTHITKRIEDKRIDHIEQRSIKVDRVLSIRKIRRMLFEDNLKFSREFGGVVIAANVCTRAFAKRKGMQPEQLRMMCALSHLQTIKARVRKQDVMLLVETTKTKGYGVFKDLVYAGYVLERTRNASGKSYGSIVLSVTGHNILMEFAEYIASYLEKIKKSE